ncbi:MAG: DUF2934 domain-containing protein [Bryobacteraceae bacterium]
MAKKRSTGTEPGNSGTGVAAARVRRTPATRSKHPAEPSPAIAPREPSQEEIARLAYHYWESRGGQDGTPEEDWLRAEEELRRAR